MELDFLNILINSKLLYSTYQIRMLVVISTQNSPIYPEFQFRVLGYDNTFQEGMSDRLVIEPFVILTYFISYCYVHFYPVNKNLIQC